MAAEYARQPLTSEHRMRLGAAKLGVSLDAYRSHVEAGEKWCFACQAWRPREDFGRSERATDGLLTSCRESNNRRAREGMRRLYWQRKATGVAR